MTTCMTTKFAGRLKLGSTHPICLTKEGQFHSRSSAEESAPTSSSVLACGLACSEVVSGKNLARVLMPGFEYEKQVLEALLSDQPAPPLAVHTSAGVPAALGDFIEALGGYLPWHDDDDDDDDWFVSLQVEGASAVLASIDLMLQLRHFQQQEEQQEQDTDQRRVESLSEWTVGVCATSYHGPPSSSPGANLPLFSQKHNQVLYPAPPRPEQAQEAYLLQFAAWLAAPPQADLGCLLFEPQWGSTAAGRCWHPVTLRKMIDLCHERRVLVVADEIMCGLGRHGQSAPAAPTPLLPPATDDDDDSAPPLPPACAHTPTPTPTLFLSEAWGLSVDAVTFGKAICAGAYPMSGVLCRRGRRKLGSLGRSVLQSHTYSGSNVRALLTAIEVLKLLPSLLPGVVERGELLRTEMKAFEASSEGLFEVQGQGLMWGALLRDRAAAADRPRLLRVLRRACEKHQCLPYFVPAGGFMVTPLFDVPPAIILEIGARLRAALQDAMAELLLAN